MEIKRAERAGFTSVTLTPGQLLFNFGNNTTEVRLGPDGNFFLQVVTDEDTYSFDCQSTRDVLTFPGYPQTSLLKSSPNAQRYCAIAVEKDGIEVLFIPGKKGSDFVGFMAGNDVGIGAPQDMLTDLHMILNSSCGLRGFRALKERIIRLSRLEKFIRNFEITPSELKKSA